MIQQGINNMLGVAGLAGTYFRGVRAKADTGKLESVKKDITNAREAGMSYPDIEKNIIPNLPQQNGFQLSETVNAADAIRSDFEDEFRNNDLENYYKPETKPELSEIEEMENIISANKLYEATKNMVPEADTNEANPLTIAAEAAISSKDAQIVQNRANKETREQFFERVKSGEFKKQSETSLPVPKVPVSGPAPTLKEATRNIAFSNPVRKAHNNKMSEFLRGE